MAWQVRLAGLRRAAGLGSVDRNRGDGDGRRAGAAGGGRVTGQLDTAVRGEDLCGAEFPSGYTPPADALPFTRTGRIKNRPCHAAADFADASAKVRSNTLTVRAFPPYGKSGSQHGASRAVAYSEVVAPDPGRTRSFACRGCAGQARRSDHRRPAMISLSAWLRTRYRIKTLRNPPWKPRGTATCVSVRK